MSITAAILILGACGSANREIVVEPSIERIVLQCVFGGVTDAIGRFEAVGDTKSSTRNAEANFGRVLREMEPTLRIDDQPRTGVIAWLAAAHRVAGYAIADSHWSGAGFENAPTTIRGTRTGSVEYAYRLRIRGFVVERRTRIADGSVVLTTDVHGRIGPKGELHHVRLSIRADEKSTHETRIMGTATGWTHIGDRCRLVSRITSQQISVAMGRELLATIEQGGRRLYASGDIHEIVNEFIRELR